MIEQAVRSQAIAAAFLAASPIFEALDPAVLQAMVEELQLVRLAAGELLFTAGDRRDATFFVVSGRLELRAQAPDGSELAAQVVIAGQPVGEIALLADGQRTGTARALEPSDLLALTRPAFERLCDKYPEAMSELPRTIAPKMGDTLMAGVLADLLGELDTAQLQSLLAEIQCLELSRGDVLFRQGEAADRMFVVVYGRLRIVERDADGVETLVDELGKGDTVGEQSLLDAEGRSATVYAARDSAVGVITQEVFECLQRDYPEVMTRLARIALRRAERRAAMPDAFHAVGAVGFALAPAGGPRGSVPLRAFAERLAAALSAYGPTMHLNSARLDGLLNQPGIAQAGPHDPLEPMLAGWLRRQEQSYGYVVYEADDTASAWTERCLRMADRVLLVGKGAFAPIETELDEPLARWSDSTTSELVLLQPDSCSQPSGTGAWLAHYPVAAHHHVRLGQTADFDSFVRRATGRGLGLVLGGGGARGFAHVGVFRALQEYGVKVDYVGGTSIGAILGATFAHGLDHAAHMRLARDLASPMKLFDPTMPVVSFFASGKVTRVLEQIFGDTRLEDLWLPCFCVSSNLTHAVAVVHRQGPVWQAARASMAIPGIFSPILVDGDLLVDGCVLNNLPIDVMQRLNHGGPIVAVNVFPDVDLIRDYKFGPSISGWQALMWKLNPRRWNDHSAPLIFESLVRVLALADVHQAKTKRAFADVYIRPPVEKYNILDFGAYAQVVEIGYRSAVEALAGWPDLQKRAGVAVEANAASTPRRPAEDGNLVARLDQTLAELDAILTRLDRGLKQHGG